MSSETDSSVCKPDGVSGRRDHFHPQFLLYTTGPVSQSDVIHRTMVGNDSQVSSCGPRRDEEAIAQLN